MKVMTKLIINVYLAKMSYAYYVVITKAKKII